MSKTQLIMNHSVSPNEIVKPQSSSTKISVCTIAFMTSLEILCTDNRNKLSIC